MRNEQRVLCLRIDQFGAEAQRQLVKAIKDAKRPQKRGKLCGNGNAVLRKERRHKRDSTPTQENQALAHADHSRDANRLGLFSTNARRERQQLASVLLPAVDATCNKNERKNNQKHEEAR